MKTWTLSLLLFVGAAFANGFSAGDLQQAAKAAATDASAQIARETEQLRLAIAFDPAAAIGMRADAERPLLAVALGTGPGRGDARARWFMAGAIVQSTTASSATLYNPLARGWLTIGWRAASPKPVVTSVRASSSGPVQWTGASGSWLAALAADYRAARGASGTQPASISMEEADRWLMDLSDWGIPARQSAADAARKLIIDGRTGRNGSGTVDLLPKNIRASFVPVAALKRKDGGRSLLFGSPLVPAMVIAADFDSADTPVLQRITFLNLDSAGDRS